MASTNAVPSNRSAVADMRIATNRKKRVIQDVPAHGRSEALAVVAGGSKWMPPKTRAFFTSSRASWKLEK